jgi:hypothetical protein
MTINLALQPLVALIAGILILLIPRLLNFIVTVRTRAKSWVPSSTS